MEWTVAELVGRVAEALAGADVRAPNGRVTEVPDARVIRWYMTTGLVDRPSSVRGRGARYGERHLLQLVAIKRRQSDGQSLAEIQAELTGATNEELAVIARLPTPAPAQPPRTRFWAQRPALPDPNPTPDAATPDAARVDDPGVWDDPGTVCDPGVKGDPGMGGDPGVEGDPGAEDDGGPAAVPNAGRTPASALPAYPGRVSAPNANAREPSVLHGVALGGAVLLLPALPGPADLAALTVAARPLLAALAERGLLAPPDHHTTAGHATAGHTAADYTAEAPRPGPPPVEGAQG